MERIFRTIREFGMIGEGMKVVAGVSGGADSVCMLLALSEFRKMCAFELVVVHVEHGIRGQESLEDAGFVRALCGQLGVECVTVHRDVAAVAREHSWTVEEAGRTVRYEAFREVKRERGADRIAVAHNQNDQAETVLWNLVRGSGLDGLCGMRPVRGDLIRPLLFLGRAQIEEILRERQIHWRTDRTNLEMDYTRNRIRLGILPALESELNSGAVRHIAGAAARLGEVSEFLAAETERAAAECISVQELPAQTQRADHVAADFQGQCRVAEEPSEPEHGRAVLLDLERWAELPFLLQKELLKSCLAQVRQEAGLKDVGSVHLDALLRLCAMPCGKRLDLPGRVCAVREQSCVRFSCNVEREHTRAGDRVEREHTHTGDHAEQESTRVGDCVEREHTHTGDHAEQESTRVGDCVEQEHTHTGDHAEQESTRVGDCVEWGHMCTGDSVEPHPEVAETAEPRQGERGVSAEIQIGAGGVFRLGRSRAAVEILPNSPEIMCEIQRENKCTKWLSYDTIKNNVCFRRRRPGDYLTVNESGGRKKLKDYLIDQKIPARLRDGLWLVADGSHILWVVGWRISEAAKVRQDTKRIIKIRIEEEAG